VQLPHRALVNFLCAMRSRLEFSAEEYLLAVTSISFDIAGLEIFLPIIVGAPVEIVSRQIAADGTRLAERLNVTKASVMQATPATWEMLLEAEWAPTEASNRCVWRSLAARSGDEIAGGRRPVWNLYGPTETTICRPRSRCLTRPEQSPSGGQSPTRKFTSPTKAFGPRRRTFRESFISAATGGPWLLGRADTTAERFLPDPSWPPRRAPLPNSD